jgi:hypothetical protein
MAPANAAAPGASLQQLASSPKLFVGQWVDVMSRTWPGINQPGGVGKITGTADGRVSVKYLLDGRHEKEIDLRYVQRHYQVASRSLRDRSMLLGRCQTCGSLKRDCGSCADQIPTGAEIDEAASDDSLKGILEEIDERFSKYKRLKARAMRLQADWSDSSSAAAGCFPGSVQVSYWRSNTETAKMDAMVEV